MKKSFIILLLIFVFTSISGHPWKPAHYVIVDTDGGVDDMKAITMLLASPDIRVLGITASPGVLSAREAYIKVKSLLNSLYHEGVPVGINRSAEYNSPGVTAALENSWGNEIGIKAENAPEFLDMISSIIAAEKSKISFICLGSMTTAYNALRSIPDLGKQIRDFIWSADGLSDKQGFNYNIDKNSSAGMLRQEIPVKIVRKFISVKSDFYDDNLLDKVGTITTPYGKIISDFFKSETTKNHRFSFSATDEMAAIFIHYPELFINKTLGNVTDCIPVDTAGLRESIVRILKGETVARNQVIKELPLDPSFYFDDIQGSAGQIIEKYGINEWSSGVFANELHRHLGVFAIVGVKMGIRAREYFNTGVDEFSAVSYAGSIPPLSCMNDGLQVSTGATPGHGLLTVLNDGSAYPAAGFTYMNRKIKLILRPEIAEKITAELKEINFIYGLDSDIYWELVRKNSIKYWLSLDRHEIFLIEEVK